MNNRFKFRVWDDTIGAYWKEGTIQLSGNGQPFIIKGNMQPEDIDDVIIEQCTGLKDKNGKPIFEGDVVRLSLDGTDKFDREVYYCEYNCKWFMRFGCSFEWGKEYQYYEFNVEKAIDLEIIGNIHEKRGADSPVQ